MQTCRSRVGSPLHRDRTESETSAIRSQDGGETRKAVALGGPGDSSAAMGGSLGAAGLCHLPSVSVLGLWWTETSMQQHMTLLGDKVTTDDAISYKRTPTMAGIFVRK